MASPLFLGLASIARAFRTANAAALAASLHLFFIGILSKKRRTAVTVTVRPEHHSRKIS
jgi:hypothetical protein